MRGRPPSGGQSAPQVWICLLAVLAGLSGVGSSGVAPQAPEAAGDRGTPADIEAWESLHSAGLEEVRALLEQGRYAAAESAARRVLAEAEAKRGPESLAAASALDLLSAALRLGGRIRGSEMRSSAERALAIREMEVGKDHPDVAAGLQTLASALASAGDFRTARPFLERALAIQENTLGPAHPDVARTLVELGDLIHEIGDYEGSRKPYERALRIREQALGPDHPDTAASLFRLGRLLYFLDHMAPARELYERALRIQEKSLLNNLGPLLQDLGEDEAAKSLCERAVAIYEKVLGPEDMDLANVMNSLANILKRRGDFAGARALYERSIAMAEKLVDPQHPFLGEDLNDYGDLLVRTGDLEGARRSFERSLAIRQSAVGPEHLDVASSLNNLARLDWLTGQPERALRRSLQAEAIVRRQFVNTARSLSEREALRYEQIRTSVLDVALSALAGATLPTEMTPQVWDEVVRSRALVLDEMAARSRAAASREGPEIAALAEKLEQARNRLAGLVVAGAEAGKPERYREQFRQALEAKERAERALAEKSSSFREEQARGKVGLEEVRQALPSGAALIAYARYNRLPRPKAKQAIASAWANSVPSYLALVIHPGQRSPAVVPLGAAEEVEARIQEWREQVGKAPAFLAGRKGEQRYTAAAEGLRRAVWDPVAPKIGASRTVFVVPEGALHLVNLATLPASSGRYLIEDGPTLHYLSTERDIVRARRTWREGVGVFVLGGPDYDASPAAVSQAAAGIGAPDGGGTDADAPRPGAGSAAVASSSALGRAVLYRSAGSGCADLRSLRFQPLPGARIEADELEALWIKAFTEGRGGRGDVLKLMGPRAGETAFKRSVAGRRILHLATHGFFAPGACDASKAVGSGGAAAASRAEPAALLAENPLLLSGLALAGANRRDEMGRAAGAEDGILTAEEIAGLDLSEVEWVVLSACETGVGKVQAGEGVLGLRRAFEVAGVGTLIMSLWSVEDAATREWMRLLYEQRLRGLSTAQAVRNASLEVLETRRKAGRTPHPFYWGAFVAAGDWK